MLTENDFETLLLALDRDPMWGEKGGSSQASVRDPVKRTAYEEAHSFYNYQIRTWVNRVKT